MRKKLIALSILSVISTIAFIVIIVGLFNPQTEMRYDYYNHTYYRDTFYGVWYLILCAAIFFGCGIAQFVLGIVVLSTRSKHNDKSGISIAAGVIGILFGVFFIGAIVSGIAAVNSTKTSTNSFNKTYSTTTTFSSQPSQNAQNTTHLTPQQIEHIMQIPGITSQQIAQMLQAGKIESEKQTFKSTTFQNSQSGIPLPEAQQMNNNENKISELERMKKELEELKKQNITQDSETK